MEHTVSKGASGHPRILLRSSWQVVNIGDIAHTPGLLALIEQHLPEAEVILWASDDLTEEVAAMEHRRFPKLQIVKGSILENCEASNAELNAAIQWCDFLLHGSGPFLVAHRDLAAFADATNKPFGVFGITYSGDQEEAQVMNRASFVFFRDSVSLEAARTSGVNCPIMEFGPDAAFSADLSDELNALKFMKEHDLEDQAFLCCIPKLRMTPYWRIKDTPFNPELHARNEEMKEHDHAPLREAITLVVRETGMKVLVCPEDSTQMEVGKEMIVDKLPEDVRARVVWRERFWLTDEALSVYIRSAGLFGNEQHSAIMCIGNGIPAIVCRWKEQTSKGYMWRDIGLDDWVFDMDNEEEVGRIASTVLALAADPEEAKRKAMAAREVVRSHQRNMIRILNQHLVNAVR